MEYIELDRSNRQGYSNETHLNGSSRDWFITGHEFVEAHEDSDLMEISPPSANQSDYHKKQQHCGQQQPLGLRIEGQICNIEREHMFDKVVTPSDVGKLNRLVIPKQYAEKYFPLDSSSSGQKGLLLNFEDITGKTWRFRYSYWSSSQSYVMTKGWSRFVKDKKLDAGDVVSFQRGVKEAEKYRLFIDWRRRLISKSPIDAYHTHFYSAGGGFPSWSPLVFRPAPTCAHPSIKFQIPNNQSSQYYSGYGGGNNYMGQVVTDNGSMVYLASPDIGMLQGRASSGGIGERIPVVLESIPVSHGEKVVAAAKKLRLFGVNMDYPISSETSTSDEYDMLSSSAFQVNIPPKSYLNQYPSSSTMLLPSSTRSVSNKGKTSLSLDFDI